MIRPLNYMPTELGLQQRGVRALNSMDLVPQRDTFFRATEEGDAIGVRQRFVSPEGTFTIDTVQVNIGDGRLLPVQQDDAKGDPYGLPGAALPLHRELQPYMGAGALPVTQAAAAASVAEQRRVQHFGRLVLGNAGWSQDGADDNGTTDTDLGKLPVYDYPAWKRRNG